MIVRRGSRTLAGIGIALASSLAVLTACSGESSAGNSGGPDLESVALTYTSPFTQTFGNSEIEVEVFERIEEASGGKITIEPYFSATLLPGSETLSGLKSGLADMAFHPVVYNAQELPVANWITRAGNAIMSDSYPHGLFQGQAALYEYYMTSDAVRDEFESQGITPLMAILPFSSYDTFCVEPVNSLADAQGKTIRSVGPRWTAEAEAIGMVTTSMEFGEVYDGLQRGVLDCVMAGPASVSDAFYEVAPNYLSTTFSPNLGLGHFISSDRWDSLSVEAQQLIFDGFADSFVDFSRAAMRDYEKLALALEETGASYNDATEINEALAAFQTTDRTKMIDEAPASLADPQAELDLFLSLVEKWGAIATDTLPIEVGPASAEKLISATNADLTAWQDAVKEMTDSFRPTP